MFKQSRALTLLTIALGSFAIAQSHTWADPAESVSLASEHVRFLGKASLNGRKPGSPGSARARRYIATQFEQCGLEPWGNLETLYQPMELGTNVLGVLPGIDPALMDQVIVISAHYDHVGAGHFGAADNAAGVGALLEIARRCAEQGGLKRTLCFAAFDAEEDGLWGALAFTRRPGFDRSRIIAAVNVDILGRAAFDRMGRTLFAGSTTDSVELTHAMLSAGKEAGMQILPIHSLLSGPSSDHAVFAGLGIPALFFSSGPFGDYHTRNDTLERLDWESLEGSCDVIWDTVRAVANDEVAVGTPVQVGEGRNDLQTLRTILHALAVEPLPAGVNTERISASVAALEDALAQPAIQSAQWYTLFYDAGLALAPLLYVMEGETEKDHAHAEHTWGSYLTSLMFYQRHQADLIQSFGNLVNHVAPIAYLSLEREPRAKLPNHFDYTRVTRPLAQDEVAVETLEGGGRHLGVLMPSVSIDLMRKGRFSFPRGHVEVGWQIMACKGEDGDLIDYTLLKWERLAVSDNAETRAQLALAFNRILHQISPGMPVFGSWNEALEYRLKQTDTSDAKQWRLDMLRGRNPYLLRQIVPSFGGGRTTPDEVKAYVAIVGDASFPANLRARALAAAFRIDHETGTATFDGYVLEALSALRQDTTPITSGQSLDDLDLPATLVLAPVLEKRWNTQPTAPVVEPPMITIGQAARTRLDELESQAALRGLVKKDGGWILSPPYTLSLFPIGTLYVTREGGEGGKLSIRGEYNGSFSRPRDFRMSFPVGRGEIPNSLRGPSGERIGFVRWTAEEKKRFKALRKELKK